MAYEKDAQAIRDAQGRYREGEAKALADIYRAAARIAAGMVARQCAARGFNLSRAQIEEKAHDAASYVAERFMDKPGFSLKSPQSYIYLCVKKALYGGAKREAREVSLDALLDELMAEANGEDD